MNVLKPKQMAWFLAFAVCALAAAPVLGQATGATLSGRVTDDSGSGLPGVTVTATNPATGLSRSTQSSQDGSFRLPNLPIGTYTLLAELDGFATVTVEGVGLQVSRERRLDIGMRSAQVEEAITVTADVPLIRNSPAIGTVVTQEELESLPLNGRQFASLGSLAPGTTLGVNQDPTKVGKLVIALNGGSGRNVNFLIDGGDNTDDTIGGQLQNFSLESVAEFNIQTSQFSAEYGRTSGGVLTVVTKSGTNDLDGSVFGFVRNDSLNSKTENQKRAGAEKPDFSREQFGFSLGGPISRDRVHFFVAAEKLDQDQPFLIQSSGIFPELDGNTFPKVTEDELASAKLTFDLSPQDYLQVRYGYQETTDLYGAATNVAPDTTGDLSNEFQTVLVGYDRLIGSNAYNEAKVQIGTFENQIPPNSPLPTQYFPSGFITGQNPNTPQRTEQEKLQIKDDFSFSLPGARQRHDFKVGIEYVDESPHEGGFLGETLLLTRLADSNTSPFVDITQIGGEFRFATPNDQWRAYVQDDWQLTDTLLLELGVRYERTDVLEMDQRTNPIWQSLAALPDDPDLPAHFRDFQGDSGQIDADDDDIAPRLGFAWDIEGDGQGVLRGGWGLFYDFPYTNATVLFPGGSLISPDFGLAYNHNDSTGIRNADGSFWQPGDPLPPNQLPGSIILLREVASPTLQTPYATQASLGYSRQLNRWLGLNADVVSMRYKHLPFRFRANPIVDQGSGTRLISDQGNFRLWYGNGSAQYDGLNLQLRGRLSSRVELQASYTYSEAEGNVIAGADEFRLTAPSHQPDLGAGTARDASVNPLNPGCEACFGPLNTDAENRLVISGVVQLPAGVYVAGLFRYRSALPYTIHAGRDLNGDGFALDLPPGVAHVNAGRGESAQQLDFRVSKTFDIRGDLSIEVIGEVFNVFDAENGVKYVGALTSANFGQPTEFSGDPGQGENRVAQFGLRLRF